MTIDLARIRADFPALSLQAHGHPLVYLDNAATTQKPRAVLDATERAYREESGNVHRAVHLLSERATRDFEATRKKLARFIGARTPDEVVFTKGTTDAINLVAQSWGRAYFRPGQEIVLSDMEHHSNIVPWQLIAQEKGLAIKVIPVTDDGELDLDAYRRLVGPQTAMVALTWVSNALGTVNPVEELVRVAHAHGAPVLLDAAQALPHVRVDVAALDVDFVAASAHKFYGPTGVGFLWGKMSRLEKMPPYQGGGDMISIVRFDGTTYREPPARFEAGTPNIAGVIGFGAALDYVAGLDLDAAHAHEAELTRFADGVLREVPGVRVLGRPARRLGAVSFVMDDVHPHDLATILDRRGVAVRAGHHCAQPLMERFAVPATARASFALYNTRDEVEALVRGLVHAREVMT